MSDLDNLLASREMILVAGSGGVGKTTIAAALGIAAAARQKGRVLVLTVDPARRLATALGVDEFGNTPVRIDPAEFAAAGVKVRGEVWVAMLDTKAGWDELITRHAPDPETRDAVLANPLYENITSRFVHSHEYLAMEQLHDLHARGDFDLVIVDTPPSRNALVDPRCTEPDGRVLQQSAAALADRALSVAVVHRGLQTVLPGG